MTAKVTLYNEFSNTKHLFLAELPVFVCRIGKIAKSFYLCTPNYRKLLTSELYLYGTDDFFILCKNAINTLIIKYLYIRYLYLI
jgi:hypothetical protein